MKQWRFKFPNYVSEAERLIPGPLIASVKLKLFFISFWAIRVFHGEKKLVEMSAEAYLDRELDSHG